MLRGIGKFTCVARVDGEVAAEADHPAARCEPAEAVTGDPSQRASSIPRARLADDVEVGPYSVIGADVEIGEGSWIGAHVVIDGPHAHRPAQPHLPFRLHRRAAAGQEVRRRADRARDRRRQHHPRVRARSTAARCRMSASRASATTTGSWPTCTSRTTARSATTRSSPTAPSSPATSMWTTGRSSAAPPGVHQFVRIGAHAFTGMGTASFRRTCRPTSWRRATWPAPTASTARASSGAASLRRRSRDQARVPDALPQRAVPGGGQDRAPGRRRRAAAEMQADPRIPVHQQARHHPLDGRAPARRHGGRRSLGRYARRSPHRRAQGAPPRCVFAGIGGPRMIAEGFESHHPMEKLSVRGYAEVLRQLPRDPGHPPAPRPATAAPSGPTCSSASIRATSTSASSSASRRPAFRPSTT